MPDETDLIALTLDNSEIQRSELIKQKLYSQEYDPAIDEQLDCLLNLDPVDLPLLPFFLN